MGEKKTEIQSLSWKWMAQVGPNCEIQPLGKYVILHSISLIGVMMVSRLIQLHSTCLLMVPVVNMQIKIRYLMILGYLSLIMHLKVITSACLPMVRLVLVSHIPSLVTQATWVLSQELVQRSSGESK